MSYTNEFCPVSVLRYHHFVPLSAVLSHHNIRSVSHLCKLTDSLFQQVIEKPLLMKELKQGQVLNRGPIEVLLGMWIDVQRRLLGCIQFMRVVRPRGVSGQKLLTRGSGRVIHGP